ncbi:MAG: winged helix-turn-helix transcriptional regulator [Lachnospiraceae bacterium]|jgi:DNA-binding transcriptional regulator LsrR (DeoR family)|nr:winged helix-turn-helix transcriptional regulator [Lachnospiraceae bacterium]
MSKRSQQLMLLYSIAHSYYIDKLSQNQIAEKENISRSQISRLLDRAEKIGIVTINIALPNDPNLTEIAESIQDLLGLREVIVAPIDTTDDTDAVDEVISVAASRFLSTALKGTKTVGLGWGNTMYQVSLRLSYRRLASERFYVPLVGMSGTSNPCLQINNIVDRFAERHHSRGYFVNIPAFRELNEPFSEVEEQRIATLQQYWANLDAAVFGLGGPPLSGGMFVEEISDTHVTKLASSGMTGDVLSNFFREDGSIYPFEKDYRHLAFDIHKLPKIRKTICLAGGLEKVQSILAAARLGYFNTLVTDSITAKAIYDEFRDGRVRVL